MATTADIKSIIKTGKAFGLDWDYVITEDVTFELKRPRFALPREFSGKWLHIESAGDKVTVTVKKDYAFDGPTAVPDFKGTVEGALIHDALYQFSEDIALVWNVSVGKVLAFADSAFLEVMKANATSSVIAYTYYYGVRCFGFGFHHLAKLWS